MDNNPVGWFEIYVQDMARARRFYEAMLQRKLERLTMPESLQGEGLEMWTFPMQMDRMGAAGALVKMPGAPSGGMGTLVYFSCDDCAVEAARIVPAGGRIERPKMAIGEYGHIVIAVDTEGNTFGLHSMQ
jgi:predicted enzyme related to lactoylglutathione lyase